MNVSIHALAESELIDSASYYTGVATAALGEALIVEFERAVELLRQYPKFGTPWRGRTRRFPLRRFPFSIVYYKRGSANYRDGAPKTKAGLLASSHVVSADCRDLRNLHRTPENIVRLVFDDLLLPGIGS